MKTNLKNAKEKHQGSEGSVNLEFGNAIKLQSIVECPSCDDSSKTRKKTHNLDRDMKIKPLRIMMLEVSRDDCPRWKEHVPCN